MSDFQFLVIGAGPGGYVAALRAARLGLTTGIIENRQVGGTCLNRGCIPTKSLLHSASLLSAAQNGEQFGLLSENIGFDFSAIHRRKTEVVELLRGGILQQLKTAKVTLLVGTGVIVKPGLVRVGEQEYTADHILIATGSVPAVPPIPGIHLPGVVTSDELLCAPKPLYRSLVIIGGGVIGVELAGFYAALGCEVTILEAMERILPTMEREISQSLAMILKKRGIKIFTGCTVSALTEAEGLTSIHYISKGTAETVVSQAVLCAIGRRPNTQGLLGEGLSLSMEQGRILVDESFKTSLPNIYAIGDVSAKIQLAHVASAQGTAVAEAVAGVPSHINLNAVPSCIYTHPEIACVGLSAEAAKAAGYHIKTGKCLMSANGKTVIENGERGFMKLVADKDTDVLLGAQLLCERATDLISELTFAVANGFTTEQMKRTMRPHPTFSEALSEALEALR